MTQRGDFTYLNYCTIQSAKIFQGHAQSFQQKEFISFRSFKYERVNDRMTSSDQ